MTDKELAEHIRKKIVTEKPSFPKEQYISTHTVMNSLVKPFDAIGIATKCVANPNSKYYGLNVEDVVAGWAAKGETSAASGNNLDLHIQAILTCTPEPILSGTAEENADFVGKVNAFKLFKKEVLDQYNFELVGVELKLYHASGLYGRNDASFVANGKLFVFDWKQNDDISYTNKEMMIGPAGFLDNSKINSITTQLHIYRYIFEDQFKLPVASERAVQFKKNGTYELHKPHYEYNKELIISFVEWARANKPN